MLVYVKLNVLIAMKELIKKNIVLPKSKFLNDAIIQKYFPNWVKIPGLTKNLRS